MIEKVSSYPYLFNPFPDRYSPIFFNDWCHPTEKEHKLIASAVTNLILNNK